MSITVTTADNFQVPPGAHLRFLTTGKTDEATVEIGHNPATVLESF